MQSPVGDPEVMQLSMDLCYALLIMLLQKRGHSTWQQGQHMLRMLPCVQVWWPRIWSRCS